MALFQKILPHRRVFPPWMAVLAATHVLLVAGCSADDRRAQAMEEWEEETRPVSESWDVRYTVSESDPDDGSSRPRLYMEAGYMASFESDSSYTVLQPSGQEAEPRVSAIIFSAETGDTSAVIAADRIIYRDEHRQFEAEGNVVVDGTEERRLWSERLLWAEADQRLHAPGFVRIQTPTERIEGYDLDADENLDNYVVARVTGEAEIPDQDEEPAGR